MPVARFVCDCGKSLEVKFRVGERPSAKCECGLDMKRAFDDVSVGPKLPDNVSAVGQTLLWGSLPSGKDKALH